MITVDAHEFLWCSLECQFLLVYASVSSLSYTKLGWRLVPCLHLLVLQKLRKYILRAWSESSTSLVIPCKWTLNRSILCNRFQELLDCLVRKDQVSRSEDWVAPWGKTFLSQVRWLAFLNLSKVILQFLLCLLKKNIVRVLNRSSVFLYWWRSIKFITILPFLDKLYGLGNDLFASDWSLCLFASFKTFVYCWDWRLGPVELCDLLE